MTTEVRAPSVPIYLAGEFVEAGTPLEVRDPATGELVGTTWQAGPDEPRARHGRRGRGLAAMRRLASYERRDALAHVADCIARDADELAELLTRESGKPIKDARRSRPRLAHVPHRRRGGAAHQRGVAAARLERDQQGSRGSCAGTRSGRWRASARSTSRSTWRPTRWPGAGRRLQHRAEATVQGSAGHAAGGAVPVRDWPAACAVSVLPMDRPTGDAMVRDERFKLLSFTGSPSVGWKMKGEAGKKKVVLELGGNAGVVADETADLEWAVNRLVYGSFAYAGQVCISVQRIYVVDAIFEEFAGRFTDKVRAMQIGSPLDPATDLGPMVDEKAVSRTHQWVQEALADGARALTGGEPNGLFYPPTVLVDVPKEARSAARRCSRRWSTCSGCRLRGRPRRDQRPRSSACSAASSPTTWSARCWRTTSWRSAA